MLVKTELWFHARHGYARASELKLVSLKHRKYYFRLAIVVLFTKKNKIKKKDVFFTLIVKFLHWVILPKFPFK